MINLKYVDDNTRIVSFRVQDWDAVLVVAEALVNAPIDLESLEYQDDVGHGVFNLHTFERC